MVYKICLSSTHGTGKTSLAASIEAELKKRGVEAKYLGEIATEARERGLRINAETTLEAQLWILYRQFARELFYSDKRETPPTYEVIICDRGPDNYCYLKHQLGENKYALDLTLGHLQLFPYNKTYLLPIVEENIVIGSGTRALDPNFQKFMDQEIRDFFQQYDIAHQKLPLPQEHDNYRSEWLKIIVNQTLQDLQRPEKYFMR